ncbi:hypothetical protein ABEB36_011567 [Hypothenemus hampei]|uniref:DNA mismatch repair proteins mutS family domain-containing protein n=1 Tax=Hypothenemus hampei TaxID=57062 RepID=A0ABD1E8G4_HYPHA
MHLNIYEEMMDVAPDYLMTSIVHREIKPKYILTFGNPTDPYVRMLIDFFNSADENTTTTSTVSRLPNNFFLTSQKGFTYESSKTIVSNINLASNILDKSDRKHDIFFPSFVNLDNRLSVIALGALYKYLEKHLSMFGLDPSGQHFLHIQQITLKNRVMLDNQLFRNLQIFAQKYHDSSFKHGQESSLREALSIYKLFSCGCKSKMGQSLLREILQSPLRDRCELEKRLDFISFAQHPNNLEFITSIQNNIKPFKNIGCVSLILGKIHNGRASNRDWKALHEMIYHTIFINDISSGYRDKSDLLCELSEAITENLLALHDSISRALDFNAAVKKGRPVIKFGLDETLDAKLLRQQDLAKHLTAAARLAINDLPDYINECKVLYLPEMGHLMVIKEWEPNCTPEQLEYLGYKFMFCIEGIIHYKTPLCVELDKRVGDINSEIIDHENRILRRLSGFTLKYNKDIRHAIKLIGKIDCLIAIAKVAHQNNYIKPTLNNNGIHEINSCRHPLMEHMLNGFKSNDYYSGGGHGRVKILTGANGSGKSIFLKEILLTIYLAHVGCYVPAEKANISVLDSLHCGMFMSESVVLKLSSFMMDVTQTSQILRYAGPNSFIVLDEFGRSTLGDDGLCLLAGFLKYFLDKKELCPHIIIATHLQRITHLWPESRYLEHLKTDYTIVNGDLCFLYKISKGISSSLAFEVVSMIHGEQTANRAKYYMEILQNPKFAQLPESTKELQQKCLMTNFDLEPGNIN